MTKKKIGNVGKIEFCAVCALETLTKEVTQTEFYITFYFILTRLCYSNKMIEKDSFFPREFYRNLRCKILFFSLSPPPFVTAPADKYFSAIGPFNGNTQEDAHVTGPHHNKQ